MMLLLVADIFYRGGPVLAEAGRFEMIGLLERKDRAVFSMGLNSLAALATFAIGLAILSRFSG